MSSTCETIHYDASQYRVYIPVIPKSQWQGPRCVLFRALTAILYTGQCPPRGTSLDVSIPPYIHISLPPTLLPFSSPSIHCSLLPPLASSLLSFPRPAMHAFLPHSLSSSTFPPFIHSRSHPPSHHLFITPSRCSPLSTCSLPPILHPVSLLPCLPPYLYASLG